MFGINPNSREEGYAAGAGLPFLSDRLPPTVCVDKNRPRRSNRSCER